MTNNSILKVQVVLLGVYYLRLSYDFWYISFQTLCFYVKYDPRCIIYYSQSDVTAGVM
jgi:hypothetical protein